MTSEAKPGRPKKSPEERRSRTARARVTVAEELHVKEQAYIAGLDPSEYIRRRILDYEVPSPTTRRVDPGVVSELNRLAMELGSHRVELSSYGRNLNQLARSENRGKPRVEEALEGALEHVLRLSKRSAELQEQATAALERLVDQDD